MSGKIFAPNKSTELNGDPNDPTNKYADITGQSFNGNRGLHTAQLNESQQTSYGVKEFVENNAFVRAAPVYNLIPANFREFTSASGSTGAENREFKTSTGTTVFGYGAIQSFRSLSVEYGNTALCRFSARFPDSVASSWQGVGLLSITDEMSFGMNGTDFGVWHRYGGEAEVRTFTITTAASSGENATVTINGTGYTVSLTGGGTTVQDAREVATYLNANATGFAAEQIGSTVVVSSLSDGPKSNTWSYSSATSAASVVQTTAGVTKTSNFIAQADFSGSVYSDFDPTKGQLYSISYGAGYSDIAYRIYDPHQQRFIVAHEIDLVNMTDRPNVNNPSMKVGLYCTSVGSTTDISTYCSFISAFAQGRRSSVRNPRAYFNTKPIGTTLTNLLTIRNKRIYNGLINQAEIEPLSLSIANEGNKNLVVEVRANPTVAGSTNFTEIGNNLITEVELAGTTVTQNGRLLTSFTVAPADSATVNLKALEIRIPPTLRLVVAVRQLSGGSTASVTGTLIWREDI